MDLLELLNVLGSRRPVVVALLIIAIVFLLFKPRRKPRSGGASSSAAGALPKKLQAASLSTESILLEFSNGAPRLKEEALEPLFRLCTRFDVFLVTQLPVDSDKLEAAVMTMLESAGVFAEGRCDKRKVMFCCTESGRGAICRQLEPTVHIESSPQIVQYLAPHLPQLIFVNAAGQSLQVAKGAVVSVENLGAYVAALAASGAA